MARRYPNNVRNGLREITGAKAGIAENVLPPGIYPINGREQNIDIVEIG